MESIKIEVRESLNKARRYILEGGEQILQGKPDEAHQLSVCPGATALASLTQLLLGSQFRQSQQGGLAWLLQNRRPHGWSKVPNGDHDREITRLVQKVILVSHSGWAAKYFLPSQADEFAHIVLALGQHAVAGPEGLQDHETEFPYILTDQVLNKLPPYRRPVVVAAALLGVKKKNQLGADQAVSYLCDCQMEDGSWCEDIVATSLAALALIRAGSSGRHLTKAGQWLASKQYPSGGWPAFDQLQNRSIGLTISILSQLSPSPEERDFLKRAAEWLANAQYADGSFGSSPLFSQPNLDDTAVALLALQHFDRLSSAKAAEVLLQLQNKDGGWNTFPSYSGTPPALQCTFPVYITSTDVTLHALEALMGMPGTTVQVIGGLNWLLSQQLPSGEIPAVWYESPVSATAQTLELLNKWSDYVNRRRIPQHFYQAGHKLLEYLQSGQNSDGSWGASVLETSLALSALSFYAHRLSPETFAKGVSYILSRQLDNGSFQPSYQGVYAKGWNYEEPLTTALTAIKALERYKLLHPEGSK